MANAYSPPLLKTQKTCALLLIFFSTIGDYITHRIIDRLRQQMKQKSDTGGSTADLMATKRWVKCQLKASSEKVWFEPSASEVDRHQEHSLTIRSSSGSSWTWIDVGSQTSAADLTQSTRLELFTIVICRLMRMLMECRSRVHWLSHYYKKQAWWAKEDFYLTQKCMPFVYCYANNLITCTCSGEDLRRKYF